jgi:hypothetical protein
VCIGEKWVEGLIKVQGDVRPVRRGFEETWTVVDPDPLRLRDDQRVRVGGGRSGGMVAYDRSVGWTRSGGVVSISMSGWISGSSTSGRKRKMRCVPERVCAVVRLNKRVVESVTLGPAKRRFG